MHRALIFAFLCSISGKCLCEEPVSFKGDRVVRATPTNKVQLQFLARLEDNDDLDLDFWTHPSHVGGGVDIHVKVSNYPGLAKLLNSQGIIFTVLISDVQGLVDTENPPSRAAFAGGFDYQRYNRLGQIEAEMQRLAAAYPSLAKMVLDIGKSYEGRTLSALKISSNPGAGRKVFFINCGIHAREWVTPATCMIMIQQMLNKYGKDASVTAMVDRMDWVIMPVFNVDGYEYSHTTYRMWRKTRSPNPGSSYIGTDPNRNWNANWGGVGSSPNPRSDTYHGSRPFSEIEVFNVARYLYNNRHNIIGYMDIHAYSQLWMTPWGSTKTYPKDYTEMVGFTSVIARMDTPNMKRVSDIAVKALYNAGYRTTYRVGPSSIIIYENSGGTKDWVYKTLGTTYTFALELRDQGRYGFLLPANQIMPTGMETFAAIQAMAAALQI